MYDATKFARINNDIKLKAMAEYLAGGISQVELGNKYGFNNRVLVNWFRKEGKYDEYIETTKANRVKRAMEPMTESAKLKISGFKSVNWQGRKIEIKNGYISGILIQAPDHPFKNAQGYVYEHRLVVERRIGRFLTPSEKVHHIDLDPTHNDYDNLLLLANNIEHGRLHCYLQLALVKLMKPKDLQRLSYYLLDAIRSDSQWQQTRKKELKRSK